MPILHPRPQAIISAAAPAWPRHAALAVAAAAALLAATLPAQAQHEDAISRYIDGLDYRADTLLRFPEPGSFRLPAPHRDGGRVVTCRWTISYLQDDEARSSNLGILSGMHGVVFPGAIVRANSRLVEGMPDPVSLPLAPVTVHVAIPGLGERGVRTIAKPSASAVESAIDEVVSAWLAAPTPGATAMDGTFQSTEVGNAQHAALRLGLHANLSGTSASATFAANSNASRRTYVGLYRQVFYTVSADPRRSPGAAFAPEVSLPQVQRVLDRSNPPAYVRSVDYGRMILLRVDAEHSANDAEVKAALDYAAGRDSVGAHASASASRLLDSSRVSVLMLGGGPSAAETLFQAGEPKHERLRQLIRDQANLTRDNPARPIGYTVSFLRDNAAAFVQMPTRFKAQECSEGHDSHIRLVHRGAYMASFEVNYSLLQPNGETERKTFRSGRVAAGYRHNLTLPGNARDIRVVGRAFDGIRDVDARRDGWGFANGQCYRLTGALPNPRNDDACD